MTAFTRSDSNSTAQLSSSSSFSGHTSWRIKMAAVITRSGWRLRRRLELSWVGFMANRKSILVLWRMWCARIRAVWVGLDWAKRVWSGLMLTGKVNLSWISDVAGENMKEKVIDELAALELKLIWGGSLFREGKGNRNSESELSVPLSSSRFCGFWKLISSVDFQFLGNSRWFIDLWGRGKMWPYAIWCGGDSTCGRVDIWSRLRSKCLDLTYVSDRLGIELRDSL